MKLLKRKQIQSDFDQVILLLEISLYCEMIVIETGLNLGMITCGDENEMV